MTLTLPAPGDTPRRLPLGVVLPVSGRALVLVAGIPGAGKSTLLRRTAAGPGMRVLDSEAQRAVLVRVLPGVPYPRIRPLVHLLHRLAALVAAVGPAPVVVVHLPATGEGLRRAVRALARLTGRDPYLVWLDAAPDEALRGQADRGRMIASRSFARHVGRAAGTAAAIRSGSLGGRWAGAVALDRRTAARGLTLRRPAP